MKILLLPLALDVRLGQVRSLGQVRRCLLDPSRNIGMKILLLRLLPLALDVRLGQVRSLGQIRHCQLGPSRNIGMRILLLRLPLALSQVRLGQVVRSGQALASKSITKHQDESPVTAPTTLALLCQVKLGCQVRLGVTYQVHHETSG